MISCESSFRVLSLCTARPGTAAIGGPLRAALDTVRSWDALLSDAEEHGLEPLLLDHARAHAIALPAGSETRLTIRCVQHAHAAAVRARVVAGVLDALEASGIPALILKGAALAQLVYPSPLLRPMRDVDLLVPSPDAGRAWDCLGRHGLSPVGKRPEPAYHHLQALAVTVDGATISIEIHKELLRAAPFVAPLRYEDLATRAQTFAWSGRQRRTLGREDMVWHVYAHAFVINVLRPGIRLISIADLVAAVEAWADVLDWDRLGGAYPRLVRALPHIGQLVPWSPRLEGLQRSAWSGNVSARGLCSSGHWRDGLSPHVWWPPRWWFDVRYGVDRATHRLWHRLATHPASVVMAAADTTRRRLAARHP